MKYYKSANPNLAATPQIVHRRGRRFRRGQPRQRLFVFRWEQRRRQRARPLQLQRLSRPTPGESRLHGPCALPRPDRGMRFLWILQVNTPTSIGITSHSSTYDLSATGRRPTTRCRGCPTWRRDCCSWKGTRTRSTCRCALAHPDKYPSIFPVAASLSGVCVWRSPHACMHTSMPHGACLI